MKTYITRFQHGMLVGSGLDEARLAEIGILVSKDGSGDRLTAGEVEAMDNAVGYFGAIGYAACDIEEDYAFAEGLADVEVAKVAAAAAQKLNDAVNAAGDLWRTCLEDAIAEAGFATTRAGEDEEEAA